MESVIKNFIQKNINLIENNEFSEIYKKILNNHDYKNASHLTDVLLAAGINPLLYISYVPEAYLANSKITNIIIPNNIVEINDSAFYNCKELKNIKFSDNLKSIDDWVFASCLSITDLQLPESLEIIGWQCFRGCSNLERINIPKNVKDIGFYTFIDCINLKEVILESSNIDNKMLKNAGLDLNKVKVIRK